VLPRKCLYGNLPRVFPWQTQGSTWQQYMAIMIWIPNEFHCRCLQFHGLTALHRPLINRAKSTEAQRAMDILCFTLWCVDQPFAMPRVYSDIICQYQQCPQNRTQVCTDNATIHMNNHGSQRSYYTLLNNTSSILTSHPTKITWCTITAQEVDDINSRAAFRGEFRGPWPRAPPNKCRID